MKNLKLSFLLLAILFVSPLLQAQSKVKVPEKLQGFWHWEENKINAWDGTSIGADYVEYFYQIYYIDKISEQGADGYHLWLQNEAGEQMELTFSGLGNKIAKLQFSKWSEPKDCKLLDSPTNTEKIALDKLPKSLFKEWTNDNKGTLYCKFHDRSKLFYENKEWDILSAGYIMEKAYRMLIRSGNRYKLIYLNNLSNNFIRLMCNMKETGLSPIATNKEMYKILGNWVEKNSNRWEMGFFEKLAIYKGDFWNYKSLVIKGKTANMVLTKGTQQLKLTLVLTSDVLCEVAINGQHPKTYLRCGKNMPAYTTRDTISFKDTHFQRADTVTIKGFIRNNPFNQPFSIRICDPITDENTEFFANLDPLGRFTIKFPLSNTTEITVDRKGVSKMDVAQPGETYFLFFDIFSNQYLVLGDNERLHNELASYKPYIPIQNLSSEDYVKRDKLAPMEFLMMQKEMLRKSKNYLNEYIANNPNLSERFKYYQRNIDRFSAARDLMQRQYSLNFFKKKRFPSGFMEYINDSLYRNTPVVPFTLVRDYLSFMRDYVVYAHMKDSNMVSVTSSSSDVIRNMQKEGRLKLTDEEKQTIIKYGEYEKISLKLNLEKADSAQRSEAIKPYIETLKKMQQIWEKEEVIKFSTIEWPKRLDQLLNKKRLDAELANLDTLVTDPLLKEVFEAQKFYSLIYDGQKKLPEDEYQLFKEKITSPALAEPIIKLQNHYTQLDKQDISYAESLKRTDHLKESKDADALFAKLIAPYKGKVVYIDFWGTWCSPCKQQMKYVGAVKEALKNNDVIFMYFANNSPEDSWKNVIRDNHLSGPNAVHYRLTEEQQAMIERRLSVNSFPTYILMDKTGRIVNMKASRPEEKDQLVKEITNLLN